MKKKIALLTMLFCLSNSVNATEDDDEPAWFDKWALNGMVLGTATWFYYCLMPDARALINGEMFDVKELCESIAADMEL